MLGRLPRKLNLPSDPSNDIRPPQLQHSRSKSQTSFQPSGSLSAYSTMNSRISGISRQTSFTSSISASTRQRSPSQSQGNPHYEKTNVRLDSLKQRNSSSSNNSHVKSVSYPSLMKNRHAQQNNSSLSRSNSSSGTITSESKIQVGSTTHLNSLEGLLFEHFTYGGEDMQLFEKISPPTSSCSSPSPSSNKEPMKQRESHLMSYDKDFQLSPPPPPKRRASLTTGFDAMSFCNSNPQQSVKLTRTPSFSSIIQHI